MGRALSGKSDRQALTGTRTRGRPKVIPDERQRATILRETRDLFIEEGYARATTEKVATRSRISKRTLYRLFPSKEELFAAIIDTHRRSMLDLPGDYDIIPLTDALERIFRIDLTPEEEHERYAVLRLAIIESARFPELDALFRQHGPEKSLSLLAEWFARQRTLGRIVVDDVDSTAKMLMDMIFGAVTFKRKGEVDWPHGAERKAHIRRCIHVFVNGIRPR